MRLKANLIGRLTFALPVFQGYSWKTNQYSLAIDNVVAYELVQPNGKTTIVTNSSDPELFFGLKGGMNNFVSIFILLSYILKLNNFRTRAS